MSIIFICVQMDFIFDLKFTSLYIPIVFVKLIVRFSIWFSKLCVLVLRSTFQRGIVTFKLCCLLLIFLYFVTVYFFIFLTKLFCVCYIQFYYVFNFIKLCTFLYSNCTLIYSLSYLVWFLLLYLFFFFNLFHFVFILENKFIAFYFLVFVFLLFFTTLFLIYYTII